MMKKILLVLAAALIAPSLSFAETNLARPSCGLDEKGSSWSSMPDYSGIAGVNKLSAVGKNVTIGDAIFYETLESLKNKVTTDIKIKGKGFLGRDFVMKAGQLLDFFRATDITTAAGVKRYSLLVFETGNDNNGNIDTRQLVAVGDDGFLCSSRFISTNLGDHSFDSDVFQNDPLTKTVVDEESVAISLSRLDDISATLSVRHLKAGKMLKQKDIQMDAMSKEFNIAGLLISFSKVDKATIKIESISEPKYYAQWQMQVKKLIYSN
jgi:hypothetical protein